MNFKVVSKSLLQTKTIVWNPNYRYVVTITDLQYSLTYSLL